MRKVFNFSPGPAMLPEAVLLRAQAEMLDWHGTGMSIMEMGHRGPEFQALAQKTEKDLREVMNIPDHYHVLFVPGGASAQFAMVPLNLMSEKKSADYFNTGIWSQKAMNEAKRFGDVNIVTTLEKRDGLFSILPSSTWQFSNAADYVHYTPNETISGVAFQEIPTTTAPLVADMTSCIVSAPLDVNKFGVIYAGAQKNLGQSGITVVIVRKDLVKESVFLTPTVYQYKTHAENHSCYNTPPTYAWYMLGLMLDWIKESGGVRYFETFNARKAKKLYDYLDANPQKYYSTVHPDSRSNMNVVFNLRDETKAAAFLDAAEKAGLTNLKGHRLSGGMRASMYNAMPEAGVDALIEFLERFR